MYYTTNDMKWYLRTIVIFTVLVFFNLSINLYYVDKKITKLIEKEEETIKVLVWENEELMPDFFTQDPNEGLMNCLIYLGIKHPEIVYKQAILETGNFQSNLCIYHNNLFGLRKGKEYYKFKHWSESVLMYRNRIQSRLKENEDYYDFLSRIKYAEDSEYINKLKNI